MPDIGRRPIGIASAYFTAGTVSGLVVGTLLGGYSVWTVFNALALGVTMGVVTLSLQLTGFDENQKLNGNGE